VRLAIADGEMKQVGSAFDWIVIPDLKLNALTLSSVFLAEEGNDIEDIYNALAATLQSRGAKENPGESGAKPLQPARRFKRGSNLDFLLFAYNAQKNAQGTGSLSIQLKVIARGQTIYSSPPSEMPLKTDQPGNATPCLARVPLDYEPGGYELRIDVTDQTSKQTSTRSVAFVVE
jgi:hypothetical protein